MKRFMIALKWGALPYFIAFVPMLLYWNANLERYDTDRLIVEATGLMMIFWTFFIAGWRVEGRRMKERQKVQQDLNS